MLTCALSACSGNTPAKEVAKPAAPKYSLELPTEGLPAPKPRDDGFKRGVSLELFVAEVKDEQERARYSEWLTQTKALGATDVELVVQWAQLDDVALEQFPSPANTVDDDFLFWLMDQAHAKQLRVTLTPVVELEQPADKSKLHNITPPDSARWFWSYHRFVLHYARIAEAHKAVSYAVGADLPDALAKDPQWTRIITDVRKAFKGKVTYVARPEHFDALPIWDALDFVTVAGLNDALRGAQTASDTSALRARLRAWVTSHPEKPVTLSGIGDARLPAGDPSLLKGLLDRLRAVYTELQGETAFNGLYVGVARPEGSKPADTRLLTVSSAPAQVLRYWYTKSRGTTN